MRSIDDQTPGAPSGAPGVARTSSVRWAAVVGLAFVALVGVLHIPTAFSGDAALYQLGARAMHAGDVLYRDHWDLKSPGIYVFHWVAGVLFGFHEEGVHVLEWMLLLALGVGQVLLVARDLRPRMLAVLAPVASLGTYYASSTEWHLTQPAVLLAIPLFAMMLLIGAERASPTKWAFAGIAAAFAVALKPYAIGIVLAMAATALWLRTRSAAEATGTLLRARVAPFILAAIGTVGVAILALSVTGGLGSFLDAHGPWREAAARVRGSFPIARAIGGGETYFRTFAPWLALSLCSWWRWRSLIDERNTVLAVVWLLSGTAVTIIEPFAGWEFDFLVLMVPTGLLAARGAYAVLAAWTSARPERADRSAVAMLASAVLVVTLIGGEPLVERTRLWFRYLPLSNAVGDTMRTVHDRRASRLWGESAILRAPSARAGAVYIFGDPLRQLNTDRPTASPIHGWAWELQPPAMWERVARDLDTTPAAYIYVSTEYERLIAERAPTVQRLLAERYRSRVVFGDGQWYERAE